MPTETKIFKLSGSREDAASIKECAEMLRQGKTVVFPTETVYGLGANAFDEKACRKIYEIKNRPYTKPLLCHLASLSQAEEIAFLNETERLLIRRFTPGPLTVVARKKASIGDVVTAGGDTVGLRFPSHETAVKLMRECGFPIAATSANISASPALNDIQDVIKQLLGKADAILDCGKAGLGVASTIVRLGEEIEILREGAISESAIRSIL